jgi:ABC-type maltose transport system permease subunit
MNEILLQTLIDKIVIQQREFQEVKELIRQVPDYAQALEQVNRRIDKVQTEVKGIPGQIPVPIEEMKVLKTLIIDHQMVLLKPIRHQVKYVHRLHKAILISIALVTMLIIVSILLYNAYAWRRYW